MNTQNILNLIGLVINMAGAYLMFHFTPKVESRLFIYTEEEHNQKHKKDVYKNQMIRLGMLLLFLGFLFQFATLIINT